MGRIVAITGGIGSGKSEASAILRVMGYSVCDTDSFARGIMDNTDAIKTGLCELFGQRCLNADNSINRGVLSSVVFADIAELKRLNALVHPIVTTEIISWASKLDLAFIETAILNESGLSSYVDQIWHISAPMDVRIERVISRNNISRDEVIARINAQMGEVLDISDTRVRVIVNDNISALLPQINILLDEL